MSKYKMTLNGLEELATTEGTSIFNNITLPEGIDRELLIATIFQRSNEFEVLYADPDYMRNSTTNFFRIWFTTIQKWLEASEVTYNPIENYDRYEDYEGSESGEASGSSSGTNTDKKAAFNSSSFENYEQNTNSGTSGSNFENSNEHTSHIHGNIGVTTATKMLQEHVDFWGGFNVYMAVADLYIREYCLMVY